ncbi:energy transducer TonB [Brevundimonas goettingensis]|uniref:Energy transducer TonB n=1 Tax=Brevundimonas goettingensis TaxID=2774190 RepID=A0A975C1F9_9CAUL|nr:energy transducer TonB [Brevundimonas goettingensis]QTC91745.1 energy transducer TonB [Brevundimonas goettingensis]
MTPPHPHLPRPHLSPKKSRNLLVASGVVVLHLGLFALVGLETVPGEQVGPGLPPILVELVPPVRPPEPPPEKTAPVEGGGAPAAPSRVHVTPKPPEKPLPDPPPAPIQQAPKPDLIVGVAPTAGPTPGLGLGGQGTGSGTGIGSGAGPGVGDRMAPRIIRGPALRDIGRARPRGTRGRGEVGVRCRIRLDQTLDQCRVVSETPPGQGFAEAALPLTSAFRFLPPTENGVPVEGQTVVVTIRFP